MGFQRHMQHLLRSKEMLEYVVRFCKSLLCITPPEMIIERDIRVLTRCEMFQIRECARGLQYLVHDDFGPDGFRLVENGGQFLIFRINRLQCAFGDVRIRGEYDGDGFADKVHLLQREYWLVV